jgi:hypothetical protein
VGAEAGGLCCLRNGHAQDVTPWSALEVKPE